jgi:hypothetical protein
MGLVLLFSTSIYAASLAAVVIISSIVVVLLEVLERSSVKEKIRGKLFISVTTQIRFCGSFFTKA